MNNEIYEKVCDFVKSHEKEMLDDLLTLCRIPSVASESADGYLMGKNVDDALVCARSLCERENIGCTVKSDRAYALSSVGNGKKTIGFFSHCDVVPVKPEEWIKTAPFTPYIEGENLFCRGSYDNKNSAVAGIYISKMIKEGVLPVKSRFEVYFGGNEESGMLDMKEYIKNEKNPELCLVPDTGYPCCIGEKGIIRMTVRPKKDFSDIIIFNGGIAVNAVIGTHTATVRSKPGLFDELAEYIKDKNEYELSEKDGVITLISNGISAHASSPEGTVNGALLSAKALMSCESLDGGDRETLAGLVALSEDYKGTDAGVDSMDENFGYTTFVLGMSRAESGQATFRYDMRFGRTRRMEDMCEALEKGFGGAGFEVFFDEKKPCYVCGLPKEMLEKEIETYYEVSESCSEKPFYTGGGTYARMLKNSLGIGSRCFGGREYELPVLSDGHGHAHQPDEYINIPSFYRSVIANAMIVYELDKMI